MTFSEACNTIAKKHGLGTTLVTGHKASYFIEAAELYANSKAEQAWEEACKAQKILCIQAWKGGFIPEQSAEAPYGFEITPQPSNPYKK